MNALTRSKGTRRIKSGRESLFVYPLVTRGMLVDLDQLLGRVDSQVAAYSTLDFQCVCMVTHSHDSLIITDT